MKKLTIISVLLSSVAFFGYAQEISDKTSEESLVELLKEDTNSNKLKDDNKDKTTGSEKLKVSAEDKYKLSRIRIMRDPISRNLYNEKFRGVFDYRYNNRNNH